MIFVRIIDENGMYLEDAFVETLTKTTIEEPCPSGFYHPKWNGEEWVEGLTAQEIEERKTEVGVTPEERIAALETALLELVLGADY